MQVPASTGLHPQTIDVLPSSKVSTISTLTTPEPQEQLKKDTGSDAPSGTEDIMAPARAILLEH